MIISSYEYAFSPSGLFPAVSVIVYIRQNDPVFLERTLISVLSQQTDFPFEIIVLGSIQTKEPVEDIAREYAAMYPDRILFYPFPRRIGYVPFFPYHVTVNAPYVVLCSDKEVWTDAGKLQDQYAFLRDNPLYSVCLHRISFLYDNGDMSVSSYDLFGKDRAFSVKDLSQLLVNRSAMFCIKKSPYRVHFMMYQKNGVTLFTEQTVSGKVGILPKLVSDVLLDSGERVEDMARRVRKYLFYSK